MNLHPFPRFLYPANGPEVDQLPVTREGVRVVPEGLLQPSETIGFAELRIRTKVNGNFSRGICGLLPAVAFLDGRVKFHEKTLHSRLKRQEDLVLADGGALGKPVLLTLPTLSKFWETNPLSSDQERTLLFHGNNNDYELWQRGAVEHPLPLPTEGPLVIADGHHRAETHARLAAKGESSCDFIPVCIIGGDELSIESFTRVIDEERTAEELLPLLSEYFLYRPLHRALAPQYPGEWIMTVGDRFYQLVRKDTSDTLDSEWLDKTVLPSVFNITDTRTASQISFAPADTPENGLADIEPEAGKVKFLGYPLPMETFFAEVSAGHCLPAKSTRFEPRVPSGLIVWEGNGILD